MAPEAVVEALKETMRLNRSTSNEAQPVLCRYPGNPAYVMRGLFKEEILFGCIASREVDVAVLDAFLRETFSLFCQFYPDERKRKQLENHSVSCRFESFTTPLGKLVVRSVKLLIKIYNLQESYNSRLLSKIKFKHVQTALGEVEAQVQTNLSSSLLESPRSLLLDR